MQCGYLVVLLVLLVGLSARFMDSTRWARSEASVEARLTTSSPAFAFVNINDFRRSKKRVASFTKKIQK